MARQKHFRLPDDVLEMINNRDKEMYPTENVYITEAVRNFLKKEETENIPEISAYNDELTERQNNIVALLRGGALHADVIAARLGLDAADLMTELTELEIYGEIRSLAGKMYEICE